MTDGQKAGIALLGTLTSGFYDTYRVAGPAHRANRARIMSLLLGVRVPVAKAGVTAMESALFDIVQPVGGCNAVRRTDVCRKLADAGFSVNANALQ
jgi:hypothetical protein